MILHHVQFTPGTARQLKAVYELVGLIASSMQRFGQIEGDYFICRRKGRVQLYAHFAAVHAWARKHCSIECRGFMDQLHDRLSRPPEWSRLEDRSNYPVSDLGGAESLLLFAQPLTSLGPVRHGTNGRRIPAYLLSVPESVREELYDWSCNYRATAEIYFGSGAIRGRAHTELTDVDSELMQRGRRLSSMIAEQTGVATFLMVERWDSDSGCETAVGKCPHCGERLGRKAMSVHLPYVKAACIGCKLASGV